MDEKQVWDKVFPIGLGERVRIISVSTWNQGRLAQVYVGRRGRVTYRHRDEIFVKVDHVPRIVKIGEIHLKTKDVIRC